MALLLPQAGDVMPMHLAIKITALLLIPLLAIQVGCSNDLATDMIIKTVTPGPPGVGPSDPFPTMPVPWRTQLGVLSEHTDGIGITLDSLENIITVGTTTGGLDGNTLIGTRDSYVAKYNAWSVKQWTRQLGAIGAQTFVGAAAIDLSNNIFLAGSTTGSLDGNTKLGNFDVFITKYDETGNKKWTRQLGADERKLSVFKSITVDSMGNVVVTGNTAGNFNGNSLIGQIDLILTKYSTNGTEIWTRQYGVVEYQMSGDAVILDSMDNIFVVGRTNTALEVLTGRQDMFLTKMDSFGTMQWIRQLGTFEALMWPNSIALDNNGNIYVSGLVTRVSNGGPVPRELDFFLAKYNYMGLKEWSVQFGGVAETSASSQRIAVDSNGAVYLLGSMLMDIYGGPEYGNAYTFLYKFDSSGNQQWSKQIGASGSYTQAYALSLNSSENFLVGVNSIRTLEAIPLIGRTDSFILKYDLDGNRM